MPKSQKPKKKRSKASKVSQKKLKLKKQSLKPAAPVLVVPPVPTKKPSRKRLWVLICGFGIILGINLAALGGLYWLYHKTVLSFEVSPSVVAQAHLRSAEPVTVQIPKYKIDLPIIQAHIKDGIWETSQIGATHLADSARPNEGGNVVIYGHNLKRLFGPIQGLKQGDSILITNKVGTQFEYVVDHTQVVKPSEVEVVLPTTHEELTLYTCTGPLDSQRFVIKAYLKSVRSI